ncbi:MAG: 50S ribosomal protein L11 methyltransferase [Prevotella sp.]|nr:50S ribosomal protein L11 methyltransferase [Prevotella sp.]
MRYLSATFRLDGEELSAEARETAFDLVSGLCGEAGFESFETTGETLVGYVQDEQLDRGLLDTLLSEFPMPGVTVSYELHTAEYKDWNAAWEEEGFEPIVVGDRSVIHDPRHLPETAEGLMDVVIDARMAFGSGTHATTRLMVEQLLLLHPSGLRVLDCGCGTGILSIVASKAGARQVVAYDIDEWSVENTRHNAVLNGVDNIEVLGGDSHVLSHVSGLFDIVLANINRNILLADLPSMREILATGGHIVISGFYESDVPALVEAATALGLSLQSKMASGDWVSLSFSS